MAPGIHSNTSHRSMAPGAHSNTFYRSMAPGTHSSTSHRPMAPGIHSNTSQTTSVLCSLQVVSILWLSSRWEGSWDQMSLAWPSSSPATAERSDEWSQPTVGMQWTIVGQAMVECEKGPGSVVLVNVWYLWQFVKQSC